MSFVLLRSWLIRKGWSIGVGQEHWCKGYKICFLDLDLCFYSLDRFILPSSFCIHMKNILMIHCLPCWLNLNSLKKAANEDVCPWFDESK